MHLEPKDFRPVPLRLTRRCSCRDESNACRSFLGDETVLVVLREMGGVAWGDGRSFGGDHVRVDHEEHVGEGCEEGGGQEEGEKRKVSFDRDDERIGVQRRVRQGRLDALVPK